MALIHISGRVPESYAEALSQIAQKTGKSQSELVREAVATYLGKTEPESVERMNRRLTKLERQVKTLLLSS